MKKAVNDTGLNHKAKAYVAIIIACGAWVLAGLPGSWHSDNLFRFVVVSILAIFTSTWKISLPGVRGTISANFLFVLVGVVQLRPAETLAVAVMGVVTQYLYKGKAKGLDRLVQAAFNVSNVAIAVRVVTSLYTDVLPRFPIIEFPFQLTAAAVAYFVCNTVPVSIIIALSEEKALLKTWKEGFFWSLPYYLLGAAISGGLAVITRVAGWQAAVLVAPAIYLIYRSYGLYLGRLESEKAQVEIQRNHAEEMASLHLRTIEALALAIEAKDQTTHDHLQRVQIYCTALGHELGLSAPELQALLAASLLHDIGKLGVPEHIISKPGKLTPEEFEKIKVHPIVGAEILERVKFPYPVVPIVRHHHEKWDGSGYPDGISGDAIPIGARILSAVDTFDALSSDRQYRRALPVDEAMAFVVSQSGKAFDPKVVDVLQRCYRDLERQVKHAATDRTRLSTDIKVERGAAPAAGFAADGHAKAPSERAFIDRIAAARDEAQFLFSISQTLTQSIDPDKMFPLLVERLREAIPFDTFAYYHVQNDVLYALHASGLEQEQYARLKIPAGQGLSGWVVQSQKTILNGNPAVESGFLSSKSWVTRLQSALSVPVEGAAGVIGAVTLYSKQPDSFDRDHLRILMSVASRLSFQVENALQFQKARGDAFTDALTDLPNARWLLTRMEESCAQAALEGRQFTVLMMDIDGFKALNDNFGHLEGNRALREIAKASRGRIRNTDTFARLGGDEFVVLLYGCSEQDAFARGCDLQQVVEEVGVTICGDQRISASWGIATYGIDGTSAEELMAEADRRMYLSKKGKQERITPPAAADENASVESVRLQ